MPAVTTTTKGSGQKYVLQICATLLCLGNPSLKWHTVIVLYQSCHFLKTFLFHVDIALGREGGLDVVVEEIKSAKLEEDTPLLGERMPTGLENVSKSTTMFHR